MKLTKIASKLFSSFFSWMPQSTPWKENLENYIICIDLLPKYNTSSTYSCWQFNSIRRNSYA